TPHSPNPPTAMVMPSRSTAVSCAATSSETLDIAVPPVDWSSLASVGGDADGGGGSAPSLDPPGAGSAPEQGTASADGATRHHNRAVGAPRPVPSVRSTSTRLGRSHRSANRKGARTPCLLDRPDSTTSPST